MDPKEAKFLKTDRQPTSLDAHPSMDAVVLVYEIQVSVLGATDQPLYTEKKTLKKTIELPMINSRTDCHSLAKEVINQCDLIHHSRLPEVEQIIYYLKKRKLHGTKGEPTQNGAKTSDTANYNNLGDYIDLLYEGMNEKIKAAHMIQVLARDPENLEALTSHELLISALGRVLREDWKRSMSLTTNLVFTFFCFSVYSRFHHVVLKCKVGSICMDIIDFELRRFDKWKVEMEGGDLPSDAPIVKKPCPSSASLFEIPRSRIPEPVRPKSGHFPDLSVSDSKSIYDEQQLTVSMESLEGLTQEQKVKQFKKLLKKQEHLLRVAYYLLLNIAEDVTVEEKMSKRNIVGLLVKALDRNNDDLLILVVTFLKKLSLMQCNKDAMSNYNIIDKLPKLLESKCADLVHLTLKLLYNLSFDEKIRGKIIKNYLIPKVISFIGDDRHREVVLKLLYHLTYEETSKKYFLDSVGFIMDMFLLNAGNDTEEIMTALCLNLATQPEIAQEMVKENTLHSLITRAFTTENPMLMKLVRNLSSNILPAFVEFVGDLAKAVVESRNMDFVCECVGTLSNIHLDLDWLEICKRFKMLEWVEKVITNPQTTPEVILQVVVLLGTAAATDQNCAQFFCCENPLTNSLIDLLKTHQEDDEIVLQILYFFYVTMWSETSLDHIITNTEVPAYLIDLMQDNNKNIRKICNLCLNIISERDKTWAERIKIEKFRYYNAQWLQMVDSQQLEQEEEEEEELPPYLNTEYLSQAVVRPVTAVKKLEDLELLEENEVDYDYFSTTHPNGNSLDIGDDYDLEDM